MKIRKILHFSYLNNRQSDVIKIELEMMATQQLCSAAVFLLFLTAIVTEQIGAYQLTRTTFTVRQQNVGRVSSTALYGILGRFRKNRKVEQVATIKVGDTLPDSVDVERLLSLTENGEQLSEPVAIKEVLGENKALLIGMPGAFTTTCSQVHLPGYVQSANKLRSLGIDKIAVITTNDRFVNQEWSKQQGIVPASKDEESPITMLCDADGDFIKSIGLADDMGFGIGIRAKRFAMITENGVVKALLADDGMDDCQSTSAANVIKLLTPEAVPGTSDGAIEIDGKLILGAGGAIAVAILASLLGGSDTTTKASTVRTQPHGNAAPKNHVEPKKVQQSSETSFSLIDEYLKK